MMGPRERTERAAAAVLRGDERKYARFRPARFYGGIATADCVGCNLRCLFCWSWSSVVRPDTVGSFVSPEQVARKLVGTARSRRFERVRISGGEPTIGREHLLKVLERIPGDLLFILETNGLLIGADPSYARELARFPNAYVRVSLKGASPEEFARVTGAPAEEFALSLRAVENLYGAGVQVQPALMASFSEPKGIEALQRRLASIAPPLGDLEIEELVLYGNVAERLRRAGLGFASAYAPARIPESQI